MNFVADFLKFQFAFRYYEDNGLSAAQSHGCQRNRSSLQSVLLFWGAVHELWGLCIPVLLKELAFILLAVSILSFVLLLICKDAEVSSGFGLCFRWYEDEALLPVYKLEHSNWEDTKRTPI